MPSIREASAANMICDIVAAFQPVPVPCWMVDGEVKLAAETALNVVFNEDYQPHDGVSAAELLYILETDSIEGFRREVLREVGLKLDERSRKWLEKAFEFSPNQKEFLRRSWLARREKRQKSAAVSRRERRKQGKSYKLTAAMLEMDKIEEYIRSTPGWHTSDDIAKHVDPDTDNHNKRAQRIRTLLAEMRQEPWLECRLVPGGRGRKMEYRWAG